MKRLPILFISILISITSSAQVWTQKASMPGNSRVNPESFSINGKGYITCGSQVDSPSSTKYRDLWEYNPTNNTWSQKANIPGSSGRSGAIGFAYNGKGYVGLGFDGSSTLSDINEYNPTTNSWTLKTTYPGSGGRNSFFTVSGNEVYIAAGYSGSGSAVSDFWKLNLSTNLWTQLPMFILGNRTAGVSFSIDSLVFFGLGHNGSSNFNDLWAYNTSTSLWTQYANFPGTGRIAATVNVIGSKVVIGGGHQFGVGGSLPDYYEFDYLTNSWRVISGFSAGNRSTSTSFNIGTKSYISCGRNQNGTSINDLWELNYVSTNIEDNNPLQDLIIYPIPASEKINFILSDIDLYNLNIYDSRGRLVYEKESNKSIDQIDVSNFENGIYYFQIEFENSLVSNKIIISH